MQLLGRIGEKSESKQGRWRTNCRISAGNGVYEFLLVEDNEINQQIATDIMQQAGLIVDIAGNGSKAVEAVQRTTYDAIVMDVQMPHHGRLRSNARRIRAAESFNTLRIPVSSP